MVGRRRRGCLTPQRARQRKRSLHRPTARRLRRKGWRRVAWIARPGGFERGRQGEEGSSGRCHSADARYGPWSHPISGGAPQPPVMLRLVPPPRDQSVAP